MPQDQTTNKNAYPSRFKKGQSGNPGGRPKGSISLRTEINNQLDANPDDRAKIAKRVINMAKAGDIDAIKIVLGPEKQITEHDGSITLQWRELISQATTDV